MKEAFLSIVLIARKNTSFHLKRALESAIHQTYPDKEILVVNANLPDSPYSNGLLEDLAQYPQVVLLQPGRSGTASFYRNYALEQLQGEYAAFMEDRDVWEPAKAALQIAQLKTDAFAAASCANGTVIFQDPLGVTAQAIFEAVSYDACKWVLENPLRVGSQVVYRTEVLRAAGGFDPQFERLGDLDKALRLPEPYKILFFPVPLFERYEAPDEGDRLQRFEDGRRLMQKYADLFLLNRRVAYDYCLLMAGLAARTHLWFQTGAYFALSFLKAPIHSVVHGTAGVIRMLQRGIRLSVRFAAAQVRTAKLLRSLRRGKGAGGDNGEIPVPPDGAAEARRPETAPTANQYAQYPPYRFAGNRRLRDVVIPDRVTVVKRGMFSGCDLLVSVVIPNTVTKIEAHAFSGCRRLTRVSFRPGSRLTEIGAYAFAGCGSLSLICLPNSLAQIGTGAFAGCARLQKLEFTACAYGSDAELTSPIFPGALGRLPKYAFAGCTRLEQVLFQEGSMLKHIDAAAFYGCSQLQAVRFTGAVDRIGPYAFAGCGALKNFEMPLIDEVTEIGSHAFARCRSLADTHVPYALKHIRAGTYDGCTALRTVTVPAGVESIRRRAFARCTSLRNAMLMNAETVVSSSAFPKGTQIDVFRASAEEPL